jgi:hypothetical protein
MLYVECLSLFDVEPPHLDMPINVPPRILRNDQFPYIQADRHELLQNQQWLPALAYCISYCRQQDAAKSLESYLEALVEELVVLLVHASISTRKPDMAPGLKAEELEEETQPGEGQTEVARRGYTVRQFLFSLAPSLSILTYI